MREWRGSSTRTVADSRGPTGDAPLPGRPRLHHVSSDTIQPLHDGWTLCSVPPGSIDDPSSIDATGMEWKRAVVPGTVGSALRSEMGSSLDLERYPDFDALDWWYRCRFAAAAPANGEEIALCFDGLATIAQVWLNGEQILSSQNMFVAHRVNVSSILRAENELAIQFASLQAALETRRPRPRWRTKLVEHQQLRWHRTTLLGRIPGWSPPVKPVGPWRDIRLERQQSIKVVAGDVIASPLERGGVVDADLRFRADRSAIVGATLRVGERQVDLSVSGADDGLVAVTGTLEMPDVHHWWPHTHGRQPRYDASLAVHTATGTVEISLGPIAFRRVTLDETQGGFKVIVNGERIFCRGACWSTPDIVSLGASTEGYRHLLTLARDAGMNMLRVGGTMVYESDAFFDLCDELGILVWQDFMFANMDYPASDAAFSAAVAEEADAVLARLRRHPSLAVLCGNSEMEQQAAMLGLDAHMWSSAIFQRVLPARVAATAPGVPYIASTPTGGALPFHVDSGVSHYYGVGAYLRPLEDARRSNVRFTSECLGFSNVPDQRAVDSLLPRGESPFHHPRWKSRVPRDQGTGWDFEDVRDHYLRVLFGVDPAQLRYAEMDRYLALSRVVTGEAMARTVEEWRRAGSPCNGALVWFFQDLWLGAGWGVIDAHGRPKAAYYALKRSLQPVMVAISDEGVNGLYAQLVNDRDTPLTGQLYVSLLRGGATVTATASSPVTVSARGAASFGVDALLGRFHDTGYAYRFGPANHDAVIAVLRDDAGQRIGHACHFIGGLPAGRSDESILAGTAAAVDELTIEVTLRASRFAAFISLECGDYRPEDNFFHMAAGEERRVRARTTVPGARLDVFAQPLNAFEAVRIVGAGTGEMGS
jgi:beta-mannosidase